MENNIILKELKEILTEIKTKNLFDDGLINITLEYDNIEHISNVENSMYHLNTRRLTTELFYNILNNNAVDIINDSEVLGQISGYEITIYSNTSMSSMTNDELKEYFSKFYDRYYIRIHNEYNKDELDKDRVRINYTSPYLSDDIFFDEPNIDKINHIYNILQKSASDIYNCIKY